MTATPPPPDIAELLAQAASRRPLSAGSLIVTLFGDAILPRGGVLGLTDLTRLLEPFGLNSGQIRTALSRLVTDGWLERHRDGRRSAYQLAAARMDEFQGAMHLVYHAHERTQDGFEQFVLVDSDPAVRARKRDELVAHGFGVLAPNVLIRPKWHRQSPSEPFTAKLFRGEDGLVAFRLNSHGSGVADFRAIGAIAWPLPEIAAAYRECLDALAPITAATATPARLDDEQAFRARILAIHAFRRACLKDPLLPTSLLSHDWPGFEARTRTIRIYRRTLAASERWLDTAVDGLPQQSQDAQARFGTTEMLHEWLQTWK